MSEFETTGEVELEIDRLDSRGRGLGVYANKRVICDGALPGEQVRVSRLEPYRRALKATSYKIVRPAEARISPLCPYFGKCGGCQLQHARHDAQLAYKENYLRLCLQQYGDVSPEQWLAGVAGADYYYRRRVRLGVRVTDEDRVILGLRRRNRSYLLDLEACPILEPRLQQLLAPLHNLVAELSNRRRLPRIEMSCGEQGIAVVFRHLSPFSRHDFDRLRDFAKAYRLLVFTQSQGPESVIPLCDAQSSTLQYGFHRYPLRLSHGPTDFVQANAAMNQRLVEIALQQLDVQETDMVLDLYCGIGNFSLPLALSAYHVTGVESQPALIEYARRNAQANNLKNVDFHQHDLDSWNPDGRYNKVLLDPPREGAMSLIKRLPVELDKIVYVSCLPRTLARDARYLVHRSGYRLTRAGVVDMFPQTRHVEAVAVFERA